MKKQKPDTRSVEQKRLDLEREVTRLRKQEDHGERVPVETPEEMQAIGKSSNFISVGDVVKEMLPRLDETARKWDAHCKSVTDRLNAIDRERCEDHEDVELEFDLDRCFGKSHQEGTLVVVYKDCPKCRAEKQNAGYLARLLEWGIPQKVLHATFDGFITNGDPDKIKVLRKFKRQCEKGGGFIIALGKVGTGKSHLAAATIKAMGEGLFITEHDLIGALRQSYSDNTGADEFVDRFRLTKVLVLDELTVDVTGKDVSPLLYRILGYRHDHDLLTVITSNETLPTCITLIGPKLHDRMRENYVVANFTWESHRQPNASI